MKTNRNVSGNAAFTLVEGMIVVAIILLLAAIAVPNFIRARSLSSERAIVAQKVGSELIDDPRWFPGVTNVIVVSNRLAGTTLLYDITVTADGQRQFVALNPRRLPIGSTGILERVRVKYEPYATPQYILFVREKTD